MMDDKTTINYFPPQKDDLFFFFLTQIFNEY
jgi:hypothetical protein